MKKHQDWKEELADYVDQFEANLIRIIHMLVLIAMGIGIIFIILKSFFGI